MAKHANRKLFLFGRYSLAVLPPKKWLTELGLKRGDGISLELDSKRGRIIIRLDDEHINTEPAADSNQINMRGVDSGNSISGQKPDDSGWEPIPSL